MNEHLYGWRVCGENLYAKHSIAYSDLPSYFLTFSIWNGMTCLSWDDTVEWCGMIGLHHVPVLYDGIYDEAKIKNLEHQGEGYTIRLAYSFSYASFRSSLVKYVRPNHVTTDVHWLQAEVVRNGVKQ